MPAQSCLTLAIDIPGAQVGEVALMTSIGNSAAPPGLTFQINKVSSPAFTGVGVRVVTLH